MVDKLGSGQECGQESGAFGHRFEEDVLVSGVGAISNSAEAIEGGNAEGRGEIAIGAATGSSLTKCETHLFRERFGTSE